MLNSINSFINSNVLIIILGLIEMILLICNNFSNKNVEFRIYL